MKTKCILHGGFTPHIKQEDDSFFKEVLKDTPREVKILLVYFAKEIDRVALNKDEDINQFNKNKGDKVLSFEVADENLFTEQIVKADVIYLHGGKTLKLLNTLKQFPDIKSLFIGKIIAADSAGANVLATVFYSQSAAGVFEGLGFLPIKIICHYSDTYKQVFDNAHSDLETLFLQEYETKVILI